MVLRPEARGGGGNAEGDDGEEVGEGGGEGEECVV